MLTIKEAIENLTYLAKESEVGEDSYILMDYHIPAHYDMTNAEFNRAVNAIDPNYDKKFPFYSPKTAPIVTGKQIGRAHV